MSDIIHKSPTNQWNVKKKKKTDEYVSLNTMIYCDIKALSMQSWDPMQLTC